MITNDSIDAAALAMHLLTMRQKEHNQGLYDQYYADRVLAGISKSPDQNTAIHAVNLGMNSNSTRWTYDVLRDSFRFVSGFGSAEETYEFSAEELCRGRAPSILSELNCETPAQQLKNNNLTEDENDMAREYVYGVIGGLMPETTLEDFRIYGFSNRGYYRPSDINTRNFDGLNAVIKKAGEYGMSAENIAKRLYDGFHTAQPDQNCYHYFGSYNSRNFSGFLDGVFTLEEYNRRADGSDEYSMYELSIPPEATKQLILINLEKTSLDFWFQSKRKRMHGVSSVKEYTGMIKDTDVRFVLIKRIFIQDMINYGQVINNNEIAQLKANYGIR